MDSEETNEETSANQAAGSEEKLAELVKAVYHNGLVALRTYFDNVEGQVLNQPTYGPLFIYLVKDKPNNGYACGFFLHELAERFQSGNNPAQWMASFFVELMKVEGGKLLPKPPANEEEAKVIIDKVLVPQCVAAVREEFAQHPVHADLEWNEKHGPVFEAGFPQIKVGNNVCAFPVYLLLTYFSLNRDPSELIIQGLYRIREEHGLQ